jgi:hypothetical protein
MFLASRCMEAQEIFVITPEMLPRYAGAAVQARGCRGQSGGQGGG